MSNYDNSWRTPSFRQNIVNKIDEAIQAAGMSTARNSREMETHVFEKSKTREEYVGFVARLILHAREVRLPQPLNEQPGGQMVQMSGSMGAPMGDEE